MYHPDKTLSLIAYIENQFVVSTDSVISSEKDIKPLEREHKEKKVHISCFSVSKSCSEGTTTSQYNAPEFSGIPCLVNIFSGPS
jgi:hypothetical protein